MKSLWKCPKCGRKFEKKNQSHSCTVFPIKEHFKEKERVAKSLYNELEKKIKKKVGGFRVESIPCCIHFVSAFTFTAVRILKNKIRVSFTLDHEIKGPRIHKSQGYSASRFIHEVDIESKNQIDKQLLDWISQAYHIRRKK